MITDGISVSLLFAGTSAFLFQSSLNTVVERKRDAAMTECLVGVDSGKKNILTVQFVTKEL